jgi:hypothetical protein
MRLPTFDHSEFIYQYFDGLHNQLTPRQVAKTMGISYSAFAGRKHALKRLGCKFPPLPRTPGSGRRRAARQVLQLIAPVECAVERPSLCFVITVGVFNV